MKPVNIDPVVNAMLGDIFNIDDSPDGSDTFERFLHDREIAGHFESGRGYAIVKGLAAQTAAADAAFARRLEHFEKTPTAPAQEDGDEVLSETDAALLEKSASRLRKRHNLAAWI